MTLWCLVALSVGIVLGTVIHYLSEYKPLLEKHHELVDKMLWMKRQGFVPQYEIEQDHPIDLTEDVTEY